MFITDTEKQELLGKIKVAGIKIDEKHINQFKKYGTVVVSANKAKKKKMDAVLDVEAAAAFVDVTEFDDNMWRLTDAAVFEKMDIVARGKEFQNE